MLSTKLDSYILPGGSRSSVWFESYQDDKKGEHAPWHVNYSKHCSEDKWTEIIIKTGCV